MFYLVLTAQDNIYFYTVCWQLIVMLNHEYDIVICIPRNS